MASQKKSDVTFEGGAAYINRSGTPVYMKPADICAMTGKSNQWIGQLTSQGILNKSSTPHGSMYDAKETMKAYCSMLADRFEDENKSPAKEILKVELSMKKAKALKAVLETQELIGKMHRADDVALLVNDWFAAVRGMLMALPGRLAIDVAHIANPSEASNRIREEVNLIMEEMMNYQYEPKKYEGLVRERMSWDSIDVGDGDDDG